MSRNLLFTIFPVLIDLKEEQLIQCSLTDAFKLSNLVQLSENEQVDLKIRCAITTYLNSIGYNKVSPSELLITHKRKLMHFSEKLCVRSDRTKVTYE